MRQIIFNLDAGDKTLTFSNFVVQGENLATELVFNLSPEFQGYKYLIEFQNNSRTPVVTNQLSAINNIVKYILTNAVTTQAGALKVQFQAYDDNGKLIKSIVTNLKVAESIGGVTEIMPEDTVPWYLEAVKQAGIATQQAESIASSAAKIDATAIALDEHMAENVTDDVHGLSKKIVARSIRFQQSIENDTPTTIIYDVGVTSHTELITYNNGDFTIVDPNIKCVRVNAGISWTPNANGYRLLLASKNNSAYSALSGGINSQQGSSGSWDNKDAFQNISCLFDVVAGDTLQVRVIQNSGGALDTSNRGYVALEVYY